MIIVGRILILIISLAFALSMAKAQDQDHLHGVDNIPDWYDPDCCNLRDCRPVENKDVDFGTDKFNQPVATYKELTYDKSRWRKSKDERYHACFRGNVAYCIYIPIGV